MSRLSFYPGVACFLLLIGGLWLYPATRTEAAPRYQVTAGVLPLAYLVHRIGGEQVEVVTLIPPGQDPHSFEPTPGQVADLSRSALYFSLDMPFERTLLAKLAAGTAGPRVIETDRGISKLPLPEHHHGHAEAEAADHQHAELDPHIWLAPRQLLIIAAHVVKGLVELDPPLADAYRANHRQLQREIEELDERISQLLAPLAGRTFYVYHPAFGYFADAYGLRQYPVETGGKTPSPRQLIRLIEQARNDGVRVIFVQPQFDRRSAAAVARAIDGEVVPLDPMAADVTANLAEMAERIHSALLDDKQQRSDGGRQP